MANVEDVVANGPYEVDVMLKSPGPLNSLGTTIFSNNTSVVSQEGL